jgi:calpain family cysteine protease
MNVQSSSNTPRNTSSEKLKQSQASTAKVEAKTELEAGGQGDKVSVAFSQKPREMAKKLASMLESGRTTAELATGASKDLKSLAGLAADLRRTGTSEKQIEQFDEKVSVVLQNIETKSGDATPQVVNETSLTHELLASYGESVVNNPGHLIFPDEHAAVRSFYGKKNGHEPASDSSMNSASASAPKELDANQKQALKDFRAFVLDRWANIDKNGDNELQFNEVHQLAKDKRFSGERLDQIALLLRNFGQFAADSNKVGKELVSVEKKTFEALSAAGHGLGSRIGRAGLLRPEATVENYAATRTDLDNVYGEGLVPLNLRQGSVGDCWYISYLSGCSPEELESVVKPHPEKNAAIVHLQGDRERVIDAPSKVELYWSAKSDGYWGFALEEALNQRGRDSKPMIPGEHVLYDGLQSEAHSYINGGESKGLLTAENQTNEYWDNFQWKDRTLTNSVDECRDFVATSLAKGERIFTGAEGATDTQTLENKVVGYHAYQVLSFDPESDTVRVRNPWGKNDPRDNLKTSPHFDGTNDGTFTLEMPEFVATFDSVISTRNQNQEA